MARLRKQGVATMKRGVQAGLRRSYHSKSGDPYAFAAKVTAAAPDTKVVQGDWYG